MNAGLIGLIVLAWLLTSAVLGPLIGKALKFCGRNDTKGGPR